MPPDERAHNDELNRFWNDLSSGNLVTGGYDLASEELETVHQFHVRGAAALPSTARERAWRHVLTQIESSQSVNGTPVTRLSAIDLTRPATSRNGNVKTPLDKWSKHPFGTVLRRWSFAQITTVMLMLLVLSLVYFVLGPGLPNSNRPAVIPGAGPAQVANTPAGVSEELLLSVAVATEMLPHSSRVTGGFERSTLAPGSRSAWTASSGADYPGLRMEYVLEGNYALTAEKGIEVVRAGGSGSPEMEPAGSEVVLGPGDAAIFRTETAFEESNPGSTPVILLSFNVIDGYAPKFPAPSGRLDLNHALQGRSLSVPDGQSALRLRRVDLAPNAILAVPATGSTQFAVTLPGGPDVGRRSDGSIRNISKEAGAVYVLTLEPSGA